MKSAGTGTLSGCVIWFIVFFIIGSCIVPVAGMIGTFTSFTDIPVKMIGPMICPEGTTPQLHQYATTTTDDFGNSRPATGYSLQCLDANGDVVKEDLVLYAFIWIGILSGIGLVLAGILAFAFAAPAGVLIARFLNRNKKNGQVVNIEPR
jgi:hypothetical protein